MAVLTRIDDPRDNLQKAHRIELIRFAQANGVSEVDPEMPADLMREILRNKGLVNIQIPRRVLGQVGGQAIVPNAVTKTIPTANATADLAKQWEQEKKAREQKPEEQTDYSNLHMGKLRTVLKEKGVKFTPRDTKSVLLEKLKAKLDGKDAA